jgi:hypothetical protein
LQTFLPYDSFVRSASVLDRQRLGKQRVEVLQILRTLSGETSGWASHPAVRMWRGYEAALALYGSAVCGEWAKQGYRDTCLEKIIALSSWPTGNVAPVPWLGDKDFHRSHQSNLLRKNPAHYGPLFPDIPDDLPYIWPKNIKIQE